VRQANPENLLERRKSTRRRILKSARILFQGRQSALDCSVKSFSESGATLNVPSPIGIPDQFELEVNGLPRHSCRVIWRKPTQIGVAFLDRRI
jgi:hypothetical protein